MTASLEDENIFVQDVTQLVSNDIAWNEKCISNHQRNLNFSQTPISNF